MKKLMKRAAVTALAGIMMAGMLTGCAKKEEALDGTKVVATVDGENIEMGVLSFYTRYQQAQTEAMYLSFAGSLDNLNIWSTETEDGIPYGDQAILDTLKQLELMNIMKAKAADYGVEITEEDVAAIEEAAAAFMTANSEETIAAIGATEEQVKTFLELYTYMDRMYDPVTADVDTEVSDEESQMSAFSYVCVAVGEDDDADAKKAEAEELLAAVQEDPTAVIDDVLAELEMDYTVLEGTFLKVAPEDEEASASYPMVVLEALRGMEEGEVNSELIEADNGYYVLRLEKELDEEATASKTDSIIDSRKNALYTEVTEGWLAESEITVDEEVLAALKLKDNHHFTLHFPAEEIAEDLAEEMVVEDEAVEETTEEAAE